MDIEIRYIISQLFLYVSLISFIVIRYKSYLVITDETKSKWAIILVGIIYGLSALLNMWFS